MHKLKLGANPCVVFISDEIDQSNMYQLCYTVK